MYMEDYIRELDSILSTTGGKTLMDAGTISYDETIKKAKIEYKKISSKRN